MPRAALRAAAAGAAFGRLPLRIRDPHHV